MSWLSKLFGGGRTRAASRILVDGSRWSDGRGGDRQSPRDQVQILQMIARFAKQEKIEAHVVFEGRPLREVSEEGEFNGLKVFFTEKQGSAGDLVISRARSAGARGLMVFTADPAVEQKAAAMGCGVMHPSTLRKAIEGGGALGGEQSGMSGMRGGNGGGQRRRPMGGGRPPMRQQNRPAMPTEGAAPAAAPAGQTTNQSVRNLIDLVEEPTRPATPPPAPVVESAPVPAPQPPPPPPATSAPTAQN